MLPVFLYGGGGDHPGREQTFGRFLEAARAGTALRLALLVAGETPDETESIIARTRAIFATLGAPDAGIVPLVLTAGTPLAVDRLAAVQPTGVFVCGGLTPLYQEILCMDPGWVDYLRAHAIPYAGLSAGAAVAATTAIVGGWRAEHDGQVRPILFESAGEDRDLLDVRPGLGLVPFAVEVHASQWGTLTRALHALDQGQVAEVWAIDEATLLEVDGSGLQVHGAGHAYHLWRAAGGPAQVTIHRAPDRIGQAG